MQIKNIIEINEKRAKSREDLISKINPLLEQAFGEGVKGNWNIDPDGNSLGDELERIVKKNKRRDFGIF